MAGKSSKKQAIGNTKILSQLYKYTAIILTLSIVRQFVSNKLTFTSCFKNIITHLPLAISIYIIEKSARPKYDPSTNELIYPGAQDLSNLQGNLLEFLFDLIYLSWGSDIGIILFNTWKIWFFCFFIIVPCFVFYKLYALKKQFLPNLSMPRLNNKQAADNSSQEPTKSKRQLKREQNKDKVRYRTR